MATQWVTIRLQLVGASTFQGEADASALSMKAFGDSAAVAGTKSEFAAEKTFLLGEGMYSLRRYGFYAITAVGLTTAGVLKLGYSFDKAKEEGINALTGIQRGAMGARIEVSRLIDIAKETGLSLGVLTSAAVQMRTFGFNTQYTNRYLKETAAYVQALGYGQAGLTGLTSFLGGVQQRGYLTGRQALGLKAYGIPGISVLAKALGMTPDEVALFKQGGLWVKASQAIPALEAWMAQRAAQTPQGIGELFDRAKAAVSQSLGQSTTGVFGFFRRELQGFVTGYQHGGFMGGLTGLDKTGMLTTGVRSLVTVIRALIATFKTLFPIIQYGFIIPLGLAIKVLGFFIKQGWLVRTVLYALAAAYIYSRSTAIAFRIANLLTAGSIETLTGVTFTSSAAMKLYGLWIYRSEIGTKILTLATARFVAVQTFLQAAFARTAIAATIAWDALLGPVGWILLGVAAVIAIFTVLYLKVSWFRNAVNAVWGWIKGHWPMLLEILTAPFTGGLSLIVTHLIYFKNLMWGIIQWIMNKIKGVYDFFTRLINHIPGHHLLGDALHLVGLAGGGQVSSAGSVMVGERGPEILTLPRGATVTPLNQSYGGGAGPNAWFISALTRALQQVEIAAAPVNLDGKKVGEAVFGYKSQVAAHA